MKKFFGSLVAGLLLAGAASAQTQFQFPNAPWQAFAPARIQCGWLYGANANITTDQSIPISVPSGIWLLDSITVDEVFPLQPSVSLTTAQGGIYSGAGKTGITVVASTQAYSTITSNSVNATGNAMSMTLSTAGLTTAFQGPSQTSPIKTLYLSLTTAQGSAATMNVRVYCRPLF